MLYALVGLGLFYFTDFEGIHSVRVKIELANGELFHSASNSLIIIYPAVTHYVLNVTFIYSY